MATASSAPADYVSQALRLTEIAEKTGLHACAAHVAAVADASICPILTLDADRWQRVSASQLRAELVNRSPGHMAC